MIVMKINILVQSFNYDGELRGKEEALNMISYPKLYSLVQFLSNDSYLCCQRI